MGRAGICGLGRCEALCCFWLWSGSGSWPPRSQRETAQGTDAGCWALGEGRAPGWPGRLVVVTHLALVPSDLPVETGGRGETLEAGSVSRWEGMGVRLCPDSCCIGGILLKAASREREGSTKGGGSEDSVGCRGEEAGMGAGGVWTVGKEGKMTPGLLCARRGHGDEAGDFCVGVPGGDLVNMGDLNPGWALCARAGGRE